MLEENKEKCIKIWRLFFKMSAPMTSFVQFERCDLCRQNHTQKKKHVYSKRHQEILKNILKKYEQKVCMFVNRLVNENCSNFC